MKKGKCTLVNIKEGNFNHQQTTNTKILKLHKLSIESGFLKKNSLLVMDSQYTSHLKWRWNLKELKKNFYCCNISTYPFS